MTDIDIIDDDKAEIKIAELMSKSVIFGLITRNDTPYIILKDYIFASDSQKQVDWRIDTDCINAHFFMLLTTGDKEPIALPICLLQSTQ